MSATNKRRGPNPYVEAWAVLALLMLVIVGTGAMWIGATFAPSAKDSPDPPAFPPLLVIRLFTGDYTWPGTSATVITVVVMLVLLVAGLVVWYFVATREEVLVDRAAPYLGKTRDLRAVTTAGVRKTAARLGVDPADSPGVYVGKKIGGGEDLWGSWEDMHVDIWGPRTGKTATRAIPNIVAAPGAVIVTSNKRDVVDATRGVREQRGKIWVFDPQNQAGEKPTWWWNPLSYVRGSITLAVKLAGRFASINRPAHARSDAYFEPAAEDLVANLLLAASVADVPITRVYTWLTRPTDESPVRILRDAGHPLSADAVEALITAPDRQRAGVYGTAIQMVSFLIAPSVTEWITPGKNPDRPQFDYLDFIRSGRDTLYLLSEETSKMAAPLVLALTAALAEDAGNMARDAPGGRLPVPMLIVLDEAANVCPWKALPDKYTHFGSRGVVMMTILQSWSQGAAVWGEGGMAKLWGASNVRVYGGGALDMKFLGDLSKAGGIFEPATNSVSHKTTDLWERSVSRGTRSESVLDEADLAAMPRGRAFVHFSGSQPVLVRTVPWWEGPYADAIRASIAKYDPGAAESPVLTAADAAGVQLAKST